MAVGDTRRVGDGVEQNHGEFDTADAVDETVVDDEDQSAVAVIQSAHDVTLPEGLAPLKRATVEARGEIEKLLPGAWSREPDLVDMTGEVEVGIGFPGGTADVERRGHDDLGISGDKVEFRGEVIDELVIREFSLEDGDRADVHRLVIAIHEKERVIFRAEPVIQFRSGHAGHLLQAGARYDGKAPSVEVPEAPRRGGH
jgi:hypothetical protein